MNFHTLLAIVLLAVPVRAWGEAPSAAVELAAENSVGMGEVLATTGTAATASIVTGPLVTRLALGPCMGFEQEAGVIFPAPPPVRLVLMPFENLSGSEMPVAYAEELFLLAAEERGWEVAHGDVVVAALGRQRVRYFDSLGADVRRDLLTATGSGAVLSGVIYTFVEGRQPTVAMSARLVRADGTLAWADVVALSAADTERAFGLGRTESAKALLQKVAARLLKTFPAPAENGVIMAGPEPPIMTRGAVSYRAPDIDPMRPQRIAILPLENYSDSPNASKIFSDVLSVRLAASTGFEVIEPAVLRDAAAAAGIGSFRDISSDTLRRLAAAVGTTQFLKGTIFEFVDPAGRGGATPAMSVEVTLIDVADGRVIWSAQHEKDGVNYSGLLMLGVVTNAVSLTDHVVAEMIEAGKKAAPAGWASTTARGVKRTPEKHSLLRDQNER